MSLPKVVFAAVRQIWSRNSIQSWLPTIPSTMFGKSTATLWYQPSKYMARRWLLVQYVHTIRTSSCCKRFWEHTAHTKPQYCEGASLTQKYVNSFANHIILINTALWSHWMLSNSEVSPRIWTCVTRLSRADVRWVYARNYRFTLWT